MADFRTFLEQALRDPLPGIQAQRRMAPVPEHGDDLRFSPPPPNTPKSAVLLLVCPPEDASPLISQPTSPEDVHLSDRTEDARHPESTSRWREHRFILTLRSNRLPMHSGQLSLPGGRLDSGETIYDAALRETFEEVGIPQHLPQILGELSPLFVPHSRNLIHPVVAWCDALPPTHPSVEEVDEILMMTLAQLLSDQTRQTETWLLREQSYTVPFWRIHRVPLWGATAMILSEFCEIIRQYSPAQTQVRS